MSLIIVIVIGLLASVVVSLIVGRWISQNNSEVTNGGNSARTLVNEDERRGVA